MTDKNVSNSSKTSNSTKKETYILNRNTKKFHKSTCSGVKDIKAENKEEYTGSRSDLIKDMSLVADASRKSYEKSYEIRNGCWSHEVRTATANV